MGLNKLCTKKFIVRAYNESIRRVVFPTQIQFKPSTKYHHFLT